MTQPSPPPAAYLFDMDGLLLDTEREYLAAGLPLLMNLGLSEADGRGFFLSLVGSSSATTKARLREIAGSDAATETLFAQWRAAFKARLEAHVPLRPTVAETLERLQGAGARMAVVTSTYGADARHHLALAGIAGYFEAVIGGDEVRANKPDPAPYLQAAEMLGVPATACAAFEDSDRGIASAVAAGCMATQIPDLRAPDVPLPDLGQRVAVDLARAVAALG